MFDMSPAKLLVLAALAVVIFGPDQLPKVAAQAGRVLRELRRMAEGAKADLREGLGPEFSDFDFNDLHPRRFVEKHLLDPADLSPAAAAVTRTASARPAGSLAQGESPPFDAEAT